MGRSAYIIGTCDTKATELRYVNSLLQASGLETVLVDVSTRSHDHSIADIRAMDVAASHPDGSESVFVNDRGQAVAAMAEALQRFLHSRKDLGGVIGLGDLEVRH